MSTLKDVIVPDIGGAKDVDVIEILVKPGDKVAKEASLITLESDKATMEIPAPFAGVVKNIAVKIGDKVAQGHLILSMETSDSSSGDEKTAESNKTESPAPQPTPTPTATPEKSSQTKAAEKVSPPPAAEKVAQENQADAHASPAIRRFARELGVDLRSISATGPKNRILKEDILTYVKAQLSKTSVGGITISNPPSIDFSQFGDIETKPLNKIKKLTGTHVHRSWITVPHVTQFGEADITDLENFREQQKAQTEKQGYKLTPLVFIMKAVVAGLKKYPQFNASLDASGEQLILKKYVHIGVAVDTPNGLVVPVIRDVDRKGLQELAVELAQISAKAREKGLSPTDMQGSCFTISSLGGIGGTAFTPIVNMPDVAILGVSKASIKPIYQENEFVPRLMLPLSLSYDHRVIDGADGARFMVYLAERLSDIRTLLL